MQYELRPKLTKVDLLSMILLPFLYLFFKFVKKSANRRSGVK